MCLSASSCWHLRISIETNAFCSRNMVLSHVSQTQLLNGRCSEDSVDMYGCIYLI